MRDDRLLLRIPAAARLLDISRSRAYALARSGELPGVVRLGHSLRVSVRGLEEWIEGHGGAVAAIKDAPKETKGR